MLGQVPQHGLAPVPVEPGGAEEDQEQQAGAVQAQIAETPAETAGMDRPAGLGRRQPHGLRDVDGFHDPRGDALAHDRCLIKLF
ncbi:hypothetical protein D3C78_1535950 [compost metagenome]